MATLPKDSPSRAALVADGLMTILEAAAFLRVSRSTLYVFMDSGELASVKLGRRRLVPRRALVEFAARGVLGAPAAPPAARPAHS
jgi:excisionase family DNA binding protein